MLDATAAWAVAQLDDGDAVLIADETGDAKSSTDAVGAAPQYSGSLGGVGLCQVAVHLTFATTRGHTIIDRALYLPEAWAADEERRELARRPRGVWSSPPSPPRPPRCSSGRTPPASARPSSPATRSTGPVPCAAPAATLGLGYAVAVRTDHRVVLAGKAVTCKDALNLLPGHAWQRMRTGTGSKGARDYDWAMLEVAADDIAHRQIEMRRST